MSGRFPASIPRGPGIWKQNTSVLLLEEYVNLVSSFWRQWRSRKSSFSSIMDWWELGKSKLKGLSISYCKKRVAAQRLECDLFSNMVSHLKTRIDEGRVSCIGPYRSALFALGKIDIAEAEGARLRSRTQWVEEGEVSSSFFFRLEKKNQADHWVAALKNVDGSICSDMDGLIRILSGFYSSLFSTDETLPSAQDFLLSNLERSLDPEQALLCDGPLTVAECRAAFFGMARRKSPRCDGFPAEFYMKF